MNVPLKDDALCDAIPFLKITNAAVYSQAENQNQARHLKNTCYLFTVLSYKSVIS